jgi:hypothetical protein
LSLYWRLYWLLKKGASGIPEVASIVSFRRSSLLNCKKSCRKTPLAWPDVKSMQKLYWLL